MSTQPQHLPPFETVTMPVRKQLATQAYAAVGTETLNADDLMYALVCKTTLTLTFSQAGSASAVSVKDPDFPYSLVGNLPVDSNVYRQISRMNGTLANLLKQQQDQGFEDPATTVTLPGANGSTGTVTSTGSVQVYTWIPISATDKDLNGIIDLQADGLDVTVAQDWLSVGQIAATMGGSGNTLAAVTGNAQWTAEMLRAPTVETSNLATYMSQAHRTSYQQQDIGGKQTVVYKFLKGPNIRRVGFMFVNGNTGFRDVGNNLGIQLITLNYGNSDVPLSLPPDLFDAFNVSPSRRVGTPLFKRYAAAGTYPADTSPEGSGIYWYDGTDGLYGRDWIKTNLYTSESINFTFELASSAPAGSKLYVLLDRYTSPRAAAI